MRKTLPVLLIATLTLTACGSNLNPLNWFGRSQSRPLAASEAANPLIPQPKVFSRGKDVAVETRTPVARIDGMDVERIPGGAIVRVTATSAWQGDHAIGFIPAGAAGPVDGVARYTLVSHKTDPRKAQVGSEASRRITAAFRLTEDELAGIRGIEVRSATNALTSGR